MADKTVPDAFETLASKVTTLINDGAPVVEALEPGWAPAITLVSNLLTAAANAEPTAVALLGTIKSGQAPTPEELDAFAADYEAAYGALHADIDGKLDAPDAHAAVIAKLDAVPAAVANGLTNTPTADANAIHAGVTGLIDEAKAAIAGLFGKHEAEPEPEPQA